MQNLAKSPDKAWISLLWSQYNKLSEPLKEGFINLAHKIAEENGNQNINPETDTLTESNMSVQKVSDTQKGKDNGRHIPNCKIRRR